MAELAVQVASRVDQSLWEALYRAERVTARFVGLALSETINESIRRERAAVKLGADPLTIKERAQERIEHFFSRARGIVSQELGMSRGHAVKPDADELVGDGTARWVSGGADVTYPWHAGRAHR